MPGVERRLKRFRRMRYTAQQESLETSVVNDWAAILMPSAMVRYGAQLRVTCSSVILPSRM